MGTISSGIGLISGLDIRSLVDQLIAVEGRPRDLLLTRINGLNAQKTAFADVSARVLALKNRINALTRPSFFRSLLSTSSNTDVLTVSTTAGATVGSYSFAVRQLAASHQVVSSGFRGRDALVQPGTLSIESAAARVNIATTLDELNGYRGVQSGKLKITDGAGTAKTVDLRHAETLGEAIEAINAAGTNVRASVTGESLVLTDANGGTIRIAEVDGGRTAADLGFGPGRNSGSGSISGGELIYLSNDTPLSALNDGNGLRRARAGGDFKILGVTVDLSDVLAPATRVERLNHGRGVTLGEIRVTNRAGHETVVDLTGLKTIDEVMQKINTAGAGITVTNVSSRFRVSDSSGGKGALKIEDVNGNGAASGLGIAGSSASGTIDGRNILKVETLADVIAAINFAKDNSHNGGLAVKASIAADGTRLEIEDLTGGTGVLIETIGDSRALLDLGFEPNVYRDSVVTGRRVLGGIDTVLLKTLNGGTGFSTLGSQIRIADANGGSADIDLSAAETLAEVIEAIRAANLAIDVGFDATRTRLSIRNKEGVNGDITVSDLAGTFAADIGIAGTGAGIRGENLQRRYVSETTRLDDLNAGLGVVRGRIKITDSRGTFATVDLTRSSIETLGDVISEINSALPGHFAARINDTGDGLLIEDQNQPPGAKRLKVEEVGNNTARDLNILGEAQDGRLDGSFELNLDVRGATTLDELAAKIGEKSRLARAEVFNDGTQVNPYRLSIGARATGRVGELIIDGSELGLDFTELRAPADALVVVGPENGGGLTVRSSKNTIENIVPGVTLNLVGTSDDPVEVTVERDNETLISSVEGLVSDYNSLMARLGEFTKYDTETQTRGVLLGDSTALSVGNRVTRVLTRGRVTGGTIQRFSDVGLKFGEAGKLELDREKLETALKDHPADVERFFTVEKTGLAHVMNEALDAIAGSDGLLKDRDAALERQKTSFNERVDSLNELLERRRARLTDQFLRMERALASLQGQQAALTSLAALAGNTSTTRR